MGSVMISGDAGIENFRRSSIRHGLMFKIKTGMWLGGMTGSGGARVLVAVRSYGWKGKTAKQALDFMFGLGMVEKDWKRCKNSYDRENGDRCVCGGDWTYFELDFINVQGYGCEKYGLPAIPAVGPTGRLV